MSRNTRLTNHHSGHQRYFRGSSHITGPLSFLNPTRVRFDHPQQFGTEHDQLADQVEFEYRTRDNRKGRHALLVTPSTSPDTAKYITPESSSSPRSILQGIWRMFTAYPCYDVSYLVAVIFTLGSVIWCINGFFVFLPLIRPSTEFPTEVVYGGGWTAFIGATIFEIGSILLMVEAVNENRTGCFGWALERVLEGEKGGFKWRVKSDTTGCTHHHQNKRNLVGAGSTSQPSDGETSHSDMDLSAIATNDVEKEVLDERQHWVWFPSWHDLTSHYFREIGFLACLAQTIGATVFWISGFTALPNVVDPTKRGLYDGVYWVPQVVGGSGFIISGLLFMLETQKRWYLPAWGTLGWHIGFWNFIGAMGFTLCGAFGFSSKSGLQYQAACSTFWGSWAFLIASTVQWYESLDKHPVHNEGHPASVDVDQKS